MEATSMEMEKADFGWEEVTGNWTPPASLWQIQEIPGDAPESWLSRPGGTHYVGMSFHYPPLSHAEGCGNLDANTSYGPSSFALARVQDPYNSWGVRAQKTESLDRSVMKFWDWLPGVTIWDRSEKYSLPSPCLSSFAGVEWADNDPRIFHGFHNDRCRDAFVSRFLNDVNAIIGPRFSGWPFGYRQLSTAAFVWIEPVTLKIDCILLAATVQSGDRFSYLNRRLYDPGRNLGAWSGSPPGWDSRLVIKFLYKARLLLLDGFHDIALVTGSSAVERAFFEIVLHLEGGDQSRAAELVRQHTFRNRARHLLPSYGYTLPASLFDGLSAAYHARNAIAHQLQPLPYEDSEKHLDAIDGAIEWYSINVA
jgi:hypothetical protein